MAETLAERMRKTPVSPSAAALWDEAVNTLEAVDELCDKEDTEQAFRIQAIVRKGVRK